MEQKRNRDERNQDQDRGDVQRKLFRREQVQRNADDDENQRDLDGHRKLLCSACVAW
jgi:hypothetical protein